jgi:hypothetical protein
MIQFEKSLKYWFSELGKDSFATFMCNGVVARLGILKFEKALNWAKTTSSSSCETVWRRGFDKWLRWALESLQESCYTAWQRAIVSSEALAFWWRGCYDSLDSTVCRRVPLGRTDPVAEEVWLGIVAEKQQKLDAATRRSR